MDETSEITQLLKEIRDLMQSREQKYDAYLKQSNDQYEKRLAESAGKSWYYVFWLFIAVSSGVFFGGLLLRGILFK